MTDNSNNQPNNPYVKVALGYAIVGTLFGNGFIILILVLVTGEFTNIEWMLSDFMIATVISFIPALLTGVVLSWRKFVIYQWIDYAKVAGLGAIISFVYGILLSLSVLTFIRGNDIFIASAIAGFIGVVSAVIVGQLVLPKK